MYNVCALEIFAALLLSLIRKCLTIDGAGERTRTMKNSEQARVGIGLF
jgi:hypothetical protein